MLFEHECPVGDFRHRQIGHGVRVEFIRMPVGIAFIKAAYLFLAVAVFAVYLPAVLIHSCADEINSELTANRLEQKLR